MSISGSPLNDVYPVLFDFVKQGTDNYSRLKKRAKNIFNTDFEAFQQRRLGIYSLSPLTSQPSSDAESSLAEEDDGDVQPTVHAVVTVRVVALDTIMDVSTTMACQQRLAVALHRMVKSPSAMDVIEKSSEASLAALPQLYKQVDSDTSSAAQALAHKWLLQWATASKQMAQYAAAMEQWVFFNAMVTCTAVPNTTVSDTSALQSRQSRNTASTIGLTDQPSTSLRSYSTQPKPWEERLRIITVHESDEESCTSTVVSPAFHALDAGDLYFDVNKALGATAPSSDDEGKQPADLSSANTANAAFFDPMTSVGRRNVRAKKLMQDVLQQTNEPITSERQKLIQQCATLRDLIALLGKIDYNIIAMQLRSFSQRVGQSGPLLWIAALDACVSIDYADESIRRQGWMEERQDTMPPPSNLEQKQYWVEIARSEPSVRGVTAKARLLSAAAKLLFPREFDLYNAFGRDDVTLPTDPSEWDDITRRVVGRDAPYGRSVTYAIDSDSFVAQAFALLERQVPAVAPLTWSIEPMEDRQRPQLGGRRPSGYKVRILRGDSTVVVDRSSLTFAVESTEQMNHMVGREPASPLVPTIIDALHSAASILGVLEHYLVLWRSFARLQLPASNEAREHVVSFVTLLLGTPRSSSSCAAQSVLRFTEGTLSTGWTCEFSVAIASRPCEPEKDVREVAVEYRVSNSKKAARNDALLYFAKSNLTAEVLSMLAYGSLVQKCHAETILLMNVPGVIPLTHPLQEEIRTLQKESVLAPSQETGVIGDAIAFPKMAASTLSSCDRLIARALYREMQHSLEVIEMGYRASHPAIRLTFQFDDQELHHFFFTLLRKKRVFGKLTYTIPPANKGTSDVEKNASVHKTLLIEGVGPLTALADAGRVLRGHVDAMHAVSQVT